MQRQKVIKINGVNDGDDHLQTFNGLKYSKQWFRRDKRYFTDYKGFIEDMIDKEYTK